MAKEYTGDVIPLAREYTGEVIPIAKEYAASEADISPVDSIPGTIPQPKPEPAKSRSLLEKAVGAGEAALGMGSAALLGVTELPQAAFNVVRKGGSLSKDWEGEYQKGVQERMYKPRTEAGQEYLSTASEVLDKSGVTAIMPMTGLTKGLSLARPASRQVVKFIEEPGLARRQELQAIRAAKRAQAVVAEAESGTAVETANLTRDLGFKVPPSELASVKGPGHIATTLRQLTNEQELQKSGSLHNALRTGDLVRKEYKLPPGAPFSYELIEKEIAAKGKAYEAAKAVQGEFAPSPDFIAKVKDIPGAYTETAKKLPETLGYPKVDAMLEELSTKALTPKEMVEAVKELRNKSAMAFDKAAGGDPKVLEMGAVYRKAARLLDERLGEALKESGNSSLFAEYQAARPEIAALYDVKSAIDKGTGTLQPRVFATLHKADEPLSGVLAQIGRVASNAEDFFQSVPEAARGAAGQRSLRSVLGAVGEASGLQPLLRRVQLDPTRRWRNVGGEVVKVPELAGPPRGTPTPMSMQQAEPSGPLPVLSEEYPLLYQGPTLEKTPPLVMPNALAPAVERVAPGQPLPMGSLELPVPRVNIEPGAPVFPSKVPPLPTQGNPLLELAPAETSIPRSALPASKALRTRHDVPTMEFELRQEFLQRPEIQAMVANFQQEAQSLQNVAQKAINPKARAIAQRRLESLQKEFGEKMRLIGVRNAGEAHGLNVPLAEGGVPLRLPLGESSMEAPTMPSVRWRTQTKRPVEKTFSMRDAPSE